MAHPIFAALAKLPPTSTRPSAPIPTDDFGALTVETYFDGEVWAVVLRKTQGHMQGCVYLNRDAAHALGALLIARAAQPEVS